MKIGDQVRFLNETGGGVITGFSGKELVLVTTADGFEYPVLRSEVIVVSVSAEDFFYTKEETGFESYPAGDTVKHGKNETLILADFLNPKKRKKTIREKTGRDPRESDPGIEKVDLHIEAIVQHPGNLSAGEILDIQMARFTTALEGAIRHKKKKIVFIHGKGAGKLKYELMKKLKADFPGIRSQDASFREYGYGATMVFLR